MIVGATYKEAHSKHMDGRVFSVERAMQKGFRVGLRCPVTVGTGVTRKATGALHVHVNSMVGHPQAHRVELLSLKSSKLPEK